jgi:hypothetical protein
MVCGRGVPALLMACLLWFGSCTERTLGVDPGHGLDVGAGAGGAGGDIVRKVGEPCPAPTRGNSCLAPYACWKTCGPARSGFRNCVCDIAGVLQCTAACLYEPGQDRSCFALPAPVPTCPPNPNVDAATPLPQGSAPCQLDPCQPCGSSTEPGYVDSSGAPKAGYCICVPNPDTGVSVYSCASVADWPPQAATTAP